MPKLFQNSDCGFYLAESKEEARAMLKEDLGQDYEDDMELDEVPPDRRITVTDEDHGAETKTAGEWAAEAVAGGFRGYLFGPNY